MNCMFWWKEYDEGVLVFDDLMMTNYTVLLEKEKNWFVAHNMDLDITSQGKTIDEALENIKEATELYFEDETPKKTSKTLARQFFLTSIRV